MRVLFLCVCWCVCVWVAAVSADSSCSWTELGTQQRFDFDPLAIQSDGWQGPTGGGGWNSSTPCTTDGCANDPNTKVYQYFFNLCKPLIKPPDLDQCRRIASADAIAYQYTNGPECYVTGKATTTPAPDYALLVPGKPSQGFTVTYGGGDTCVSNGNSRQFRVHVRCSANLPADPQLSYDNSKMAPMINANARMSHRVLSSSSSSLSTLSLGSSSSCTLGYDGFTPDCHIYVGNVYEDAVTKCLYHVHINTVFGCPSSCRTGATACSDHGICAEDSDAKSTRCFCDHGWGGDQCQNAVDTSSATSSRSPNTVLTVFVLILLFAALGLGYALYRKIRGFHGDFDHQYGQLGDEAGKPGRGIQINQA